MTSAPPVQLGFGVTVTHRLVWLAVPQLTLKLVWFRLTADACTLLMTVGLADKNAQQQAGAADERQVFSFQRDIEAWLKIP